MARDYRQRIQMRFNIVQLDNIIVCLLNNPVNKKFVSNVKKLFENFLSESYMNDYEKEYRVFLIKRIATVILENNINEKENVLNYLSVDGKYSMDVDNLLNQLFEDEGREEDFFLIDKLISQQLRYGIVSSEADKLSEMITNFQTDNYDDLDSFMSSFSDQIDGIEKGLRQAKESIEASKNDISLSESSFLESLKRIIAEEKNPSSRIKTGIQCLNEILDGGYERGRVYMAMGMAKGWKSGFLLNSAIWGIKYNSPTTQDPTKRPVVLYLSQENTLSETVKRIWAYSFGNDSKMSDYTPAEAARMLETAGIFTPNDPTKPELVMWYRPNKSISTADLNSMLDDLEKQGKECVFLVQDYIKRLRPTTPNKELRIELANISDELTVIAKQRNIPILTAAQLRLGLSFLRETFLNTGTSLYENQ